MSGNLTRRRFIKKSAIGASMAALGTAGCSTISNTSPRIARGVPANSKIRLGFIGVGHRATGILKDILKQPHVEVTAICDIWKDHLDKAIAICKGRPKGYHDYHELLASNNVDAVVIGTPPHWHALQAIHTCQAGKDLYLEKPMTMSVAECLAVRNAVRKHKIISQIGTQVHAGNNYRRVVEMIRSGRLGQINVVRTFNMIDQRVEGIGNTPDGDPPKGLDWNRWIGPAPMQPFNARLAQSAYHHPSFSISGGWTPGMAPHIVDLPYWALELGHPLKISSHGGRYVIKDCGDAYDTQDVIWQYPNMNMTWMTSMTNSYGFDFQGKLGRRRRNGIYFHGVNGTLLANYGICRIVPEDVPKKIANDDQETEKFVADWNTRMDKEFPVNKIPPSPGHDREWLDGIRTRKQPSCCVDYHYKIDMAINLAMMAMKLGRTVEFDPVKETVVGDSEAVKLMYPEYRDSWKLPAEYL
ncbi:MAG: Gfo/Idh/MocA family oxidoreductase [Planctomycetota bacterium]|nr:MAG: Gfo/Idh/MocA family oxidoreductase [Planctomycetota bacterium]